MMGSGYTSREFCDGHSLASPGRWEPHARKYPESPCWKRVTSLYMDFAHRVGTTSRLLEVALGRVVKSPFREEELVGFERCSTSRSQSFRTQSEDQPHRPKRRAHRLPIPRTVTGSRRGSRSRDRLLRRRSTSRTWRPNAWVAGVVLAKLLEQSDALDHLKEAVEGDPEWRRNYSTLAELSEQVTAVLEDQAERGQVLKLSEHEARKKYPHLVIASLGANTKDKPNGVVTSRVPFNGSHGISVNRRTRIGDQERAPIAADLKRAMREKSKTGQNT